MDIFTLLERLAFNLSSCFSFPLSLSLFPHTKVFSGHKMCFKWNNSVLNVIFCVCAEHSIFYESNANFCQTQTRCLRETSIPHSVPNSLFLLSPFFVCFLMKKRQKTDHSFCKYFISLSMLSCNMSINSFKKKAQQAFNCFNITYVAS